MSTKGTFGRTGDTGPGRATPTGSGSPSKLRGFSSTFSASRSWASIGHLPIMAAVLCGQPRGSFRAVFLLLMLRQGPRAADVEGGHARGQLRASGGHGGAGKGVLCVVLQIFVQYTRYVLVLKWLTLSLFAYFGTVMVVD